MTRTDITTSASIDALVEAVCDWADKATPGECSIGMAERLAAASRAIAWKYKESVEADRKARALDIELKELMSAAAAERKLKDAIIQCLGE